ncbi:MAG: acetyl-CoA hydrolase [Lysobacterales bacterium CG02_land_8_20_14_3_00_62_12]|nr:MAG: acetyl-CoA hydrolase [Xanthomonadales bacterium CG02_land_8_20_14_3_00_62_12]
MTDALSTLTAAIDRIVAVCGPNIVAGFPLGLGKPNRLINALTARVTADPSLTLTIYTALSLDPPTPKPGLESAFAQPFLDRQFGADYPRLDYVRAQHLGTLCARIQVHEFYFQSGNWLDSSAAQRHYISLNYTHVARALVGFGVNVMLHLVARRGDRLSLSCNTDVTLDALDAFAARGKPRPLLVCAIHPDLPFLGNDASVPLTFADVLVDEPGHQLFALPREPVAVHEYAIGLHASTLVKDGGTLQIGIGALSDAIVAALLLRQQENTFYRQATTALRLGREAPPLISDCGGEAPFALGLYGASEMVMDGFMHLRRAGILRRQVFSDIGLQTLLNQGRIGASADADTLERLIEAGLVPTAMDRPTLTWLVKFGLLSTGCTIADGVIRYADGSQSGADLLDGGHRHALAAQITGRPLRGGHYLHGAFYLGSKCLYDWLGQLQGDDFDGLGMTRVSFVNELYGGAEALDIAQRHQARFFNTCMIHTLSGAAVSDGLADGRVVSGVGGQYNFVAMANAIPNGRSILMLRSVRERQGRVSSNLVWNYGHTTIPRHLRDIVITEYGIADLRGQCDEVVIQRLLAITDARFQDELVATAKAAGKLDRAFTLPEDWRRNTPAALLAAIQGLGQPERFPRYPFGSDFNAEELALLPALGQLKAATSNARGKLGLMLKALAAGAPTAAQNARLQRLGLAAPARFKDRLLARMVAGFLPPD